MSGMDPRIDGLRDLLVRIDAKLDAVLAAQRDGGTGAEPKETGQIADDADLDHPDFGDPAIWLDNVRGWDGEPMKGRKMSQCPSEFLELLATALDNIGTSQKRSGNSKYWRNHKDAGRARAWAMRIANS